MYGVFFCVCVCVALITSTGLLKFSTFNFQILTVIVATLIFPGVEKDNDGVYTFNYNKMGV